MSRTSTTTATSARTRSTAGISDLARGPQDEAERVDEAEELAELTAFRAEVSAKVADWSKAAIIDSAVFEDHVRELADDVYGSDVIADLGPFMDWERYADAHKVDYGVVVVDGETYHAR